MDKLQVNTLRENYFEAFENVFELKDYREPPSEGLDLQEALEMKKKLSSGPVALEEIKQAAEILKRLEAVLSARGLSSKCAFEDSHKRVNKLLAQRDSRP